ncbi:hypothetical protein Bhyg_08612 [Pseudolycoriella hygida]|uniref:Uncharacterized protein n=1 Tax=Pseudolycoriella hygida TaxID=35572 RepID=A0A9Q0S3R6_9DIPT|nr:hypothetical protein Bhyg_08612 [Pseudolycoriella hygida]
MAVAVNLSEQCDDEKLISYPNIDKLMEAFALDLSKSIESFPYTVKFYINVISKIRTPVVGMFASIRILNKFLSVENCTLHTIVDDVGKRSYNRYNEVPDECEDRDRQSENYPVYDPSRSRATSKHITINRNEYLTLIFYLFKSYVEIYRTHDLLELLLANEVATTSDSNKQFNELREKAIRDRTQRIDYDKINWKQLRATDPIPQTPLQECRKVFLNASKFPKYQEDLHQLLKLKKLVGVTAVVEQEGSFKKFCEAVRGYLSIPDEKR